MPIYVRLKKGIIEAPKYGKIIYPSENYIKIEDRYKSLVEKDERLEIKNQEEMDEIVNKEDNLINDIVLGHWKQSEKRIAELSNKVFLEKVLVAAKKASKNKIAEIVTDRLEELK